MRRNFVAASLLASVAFVGAPTGAVAQDAVQTGTVAPVNNNGTPADDVGPADTIVVTGSRIARPALESAVPLTSVTIDQLTATGNVSIGDALNDLPSLRSTFSQANSTQFIGTTGLNILDLRGLGPSRTLVLVNGKRHITASEGEFLVDTNTIPVDLTERVDVVTGGSSAVYGSDAIGGVVNFILKRDFEGVSLRGQGGISSRGDRGAYFGALTAGQNFAEGRGNIAVSLEYAKSNTLLNLDRPDFTGAFNGRRQFQLTDNPANPDDDVPDRTFINGGIRSLNLSDGGSFIAYPGATTTACVSRTAPGCLANGRPRIFRFGTGGTLTEANYGTDYRPIGSGNTLGGDGSTLNNSGVLQPGLQRYSANIIGHYDFSDAFQPYFEAKYVRVESEQQSSPTFAQGGSQAVGSARTYATNSTGIPIGLDNPYLTPAAAATIRSLLPAGASFFRLQRNNIDLGIRGEFATRQTYRAVVGVQGTFNDDWKYDVSAVYGRFDNRVLSTNNRIEQRFRNSVDAVRNAAGQIVCRINQAGITDPNCVPVNLLGEGSPSAEARNYFMANTRYRGRAQEYVASGSVTGDLSQLFELPGGPVAFSVGAEYRRETASYAYDALVSSGQTFLNAIAPFDPPAFAVKEAFGEINVPILKDVPFFYDLSLQGAARVSDYKGSVGTTFAWNAGGTWAPIRDIRIRGNYSKSVRSPTLGDLYSSPSQNFAFINDPCDANFSSSGNNDGANRQANCRALGIDPSTFENSAARSGNLAILSGGNSQLSEESSRSWTVGAVIQPRFLPGFSATVDYYDIKVSNVVSAISAQQIVDSCFDSADLNNQFCALINPRQANGFFSAPALLQSSVNFSALKAKGIDVDLAYNRRIAPDTSATLRFIGTWVRNRSDFPYLDTPDLPERIKGELGDPIYAFNASADIKYKSVTVGYQLRYVGRQSVTDWEATHDSPQGPAYDVDYSDPQFFPDVWYHDIRLGADINERFNLYVGVDNVFDRLPPLGLLGTSDGGAIYSNTGRFMYAGVKAKF